MIEQPAGNALSKTKTGDPLVQTADFLGQVRTLLELAPRYLQEPEADLALKLVLDQAETIAQLEAVELYAVGRSDSLLQVARYQGDDSFVDYEALRAAFVGSGFEPLPSAIAQQCVRQNAPHHYVKAKAGEDGPALHPEGDAITLQAQTGASLACPILVGSEVQGVLVAHTASHSGFDEESCQLTLTLASFVASVFQRYSSQIENEQSQSVLRRIIDSTGQWIGLVDFSNRIALANEAYAHHLCLTTGRPLEDLVVDDTFLEEVSAPFADSEAFARSMEQWLCSDSRNRGVFLTCAGRYLEFQVTPINELGHLIIITDVTTEKLQQEALREAREAAAAANRTKSTFLANMSHEIRTPMTAIMGYADVLMKNELENDEQHSAIETIQNNSQHLLTVINDILDISRVETGKLSVERVDVSLGDVLTAAMDLAGGLADAKGLELRLTFQTPAPETIQSDPIRLKQILVNVLSNAVKFTRCGAVDLDVSFEALEENGNVLRFLVTDTGRGMTVEQSERLFQLFSQADESTTRRFGGTGLGLHISRSLTKLLGGDLRLVQTKPGEGSVFEITVDPGECAGPRINSLPDDPGHDFPKELGNEKLPPCRILLTEDGPDNQRLIRHMLLKAGAAEVTVAENGVEALRRVDEDPNAFDFVLMDMQMPEMDGYEATRALREQGFTQPIVALTAHAMAEDRGKCLAAGCDDYATKPIDRDRLVYAIRTALEKTPVQLQPVE